MNNYLPIHFLKTLGYGGLAVAFFMIPHAFFVGSHKGFPMATFHHATKYISETENILSIILILISIIGIIVFSFLHFKSLYSNLQKSKENKKIYQTQKGTNLEATIFAKPLAIAMSVNVGFIIGAMFIPNLHLIFEYLFPGAIIAFIMIGIWQIKLLNQKINTMMNIDGNSTFDWNKTNNFALLLIPFSFLMTAVGLAAPAAMSNILAIQTIGFISSLFFTLISTTMFAILFISSVENIVKQGNFALSAGATIWISVPIITLLAIISIRLNHGLEVVFNTHNSSTGLLIVVVSFVLEIVILLTGYLYLKRSDFLKMELDTERLGANPSVYGLICPGVAFSVLTGLVAMFATKTHLIQPYSIGWFIILIVWGIALYQTIKTLSTLNKKYNI
jgi:flagellar biogenesis protein FliO